MTIYDAESWIIARKKFWTTSRYGTWQQRAILKPALELVLACSISGDFDLLRAVGITLDHPEDLFPNLTLSGSFATVSSVPMDIETLAVMSSLFERQPRTGVVQGYLPFIKNVKAYPS